MDFYNKQIPSFGVAGNFTGHLEQAGEAQDFTNIKTAEENAPKALFPTFIPQNAESETTEKNNEKITPLFLKTFPFDSEKIIFPKNEEKIQIEPECAILCELKWDNKKIIKIIPKSFAASNDCSIRKEGAKKISMKKNWGSSSKGLSKNQIDIDNFSEEGNINLYRIASFLVRGGKIFDYGEDSKISDYSYIYGKLLLWILEKLNNQKDEGPAENIYQYLVEAGCPGKIMVSIGATRYTEFGEKNFLRAGDKTIVVLYPETKYTHEEISSFALNENFSDKDISALIQRVEI